MTQAAANKTSFKIWCALGALACICVVLTWRWYDRNSEEYLQRGKLVRDGSLSALEKRLGPPVETWKHYEDIRPDFRDKVYTLEDERAGFILSSYVFWGYGTIGIRGVLVFVKTKPGADQIYAFKMYYD